MSDLTPRQQQILDLIVESVETRGYPPTVRELCDASGLTSSSSVAHHLAELQHMGRIRRDPNRPRAITVLTTPDDVEAARLLDEVARERHEDWWSE